MPKVPRHLQCDHCATWVPYVVIGHQRIYDASEFPKGGTVLCQRCAETQRAQDKAKAAKSDGQAPLL